MINTPRLAWLDADPLREINALKLERLAAGQEIFDLSMINPDLTPARFLLDKLLESSVRGNNHRYAVARGVRKLREAFAEKYRAAWGVAVDPETEVCVTMGSKDALEHSLSALGAPGDRILLGVPVYPAFLSALQLAQLVPCFFPIVDDEEVMLTAIAKQMEAHRPKALLLNFPNNPTGITVSGEFLKKLLDLARTFGVFVINDFVYGEMQFSGGVAVSLLQVASSSDRVAEIYSLSKAYSIPGWRIGAVLGNSQLVRTLSQLKAHIDYGIFLPLQHASAAGLTQGAIIPKEVTVHYAERHAAMRAGLDKLGWKVSPARSGCCVWAAIPSRFIGCNSQEVTRNLLTATGVVGLPGSAFGRSRDDTPDSEDVALDRMIRFALVLPMAGLRSVLERIALWSAETAPQANIQTDATP